MNPETKANLYNIFALLCGIWFLLTGWMWTYYASLFIAYPVGLIGLVLWRLGRKINPNSILNKAALGLLITGLVGSIAAIFLFK